VRKNSKRQTPLPPRLPLIIVITVRSVQSVRGANVASGEP